MTIHHGNYYLQWCNRLGRAMPRMDCGEARIMTSFFDQPVIYFLRSFTTTRTITPDETHGHKWWWIGRWNRARDPRKCFSWPEYLVWVRCYYEVFTVPSCCVASRKIHSSSSGSTWKSRQVSESYRRVYDMVRTTYLSLSFRPFIKAGGPGWTALLERDWLLWLTLKGVMKEAVQKSVWSWSW